MDRLWSGRGCAAAEPEPGDEQEGSEEQEGGDCRLGNDVEAVGAGALV